MCGIYGKVGYGLAGGEDPGDLGDEYQCEQRERAQRAISALNHRGPDAQGVWQDGGVTLAHARLKILDLSQKAAQPMTNENGRVVVVYNGEIYNFESLRRQLESLGHRFRSLSDTEVLVHGYEQWGVEVLHRLEGMFAFGLWDAERRSLFLARDRGGQKPLFYHWDERGSLAFSSEIKGLLAAGVGQNPRSRSVVDYLVYGYVPPSHTFYEGVFQLPPAHYLFVPFKEGFPQNPSDITPQTYWQPSFEGRRDKPSLREASHSVRHVVEKAVEKRLISDVPLGAFLSGGLDSTIVVGIMSQRLQKKVKTFSIGFSADHRYDETNFARVAAEAFHTDHTEFYVDPQPMDFVEELVLAHDGPFADSSAIPTAILSKLTRDHVTVVLTGDGGDEVFAGYDRFWAGVLSEKVPSFLRRGLPYIEEWIPAKDERTFWGRLRRFVKGLSVPLPQRMLCWQPHFACGIQELCRPELLSESLGPDIQKRERLQEELFEFARRVFSQTEGKTALARLLDHNFRTYLPYDLQVKMDRCSMRYSLEARSPFLDHKLIEECATLPDVYKMCGGMTKVILRHAFRDLVPLSILLRGKMGFGVPLDTWFRTRWRGDLEDRLLNPRARIYDYLQGQQVFGMVSDHLEGKAHWGHQLFALLTLELWLQRIGQPVPVSLAV